MTISDILLEIDAEIAKLQQVKAILSGVPAKQKSGRPVTGSAGGVATSFNPEEFVGTQAKPKRRTMSPETRKKMADAQRLRWANSKKTTN